VLVRCSLPCSASTDVSTRPVDNKIKLGTQAIARIGYLILRFRTPNGHFTMY
jgi:hypothetical protein